VQLPAIATLVEADSLLAALAAALPSNGDSLRIDASALQHFDTSLVALLLHTRRAAQAAGGTMEIVGAPAKLADLARLYGVESLLPLAGTETVAP
jgi:phospholipid transport system transporter-binding protein